MDEIRIHFINSLLIHLLTLTVILFCNKYKISGAIHNNLLSNNVFTRLISIVSPVTVKTYNPPKHIHFKGILVYTNPS